MNQYPNGPQGPYPSNPGYPPNGTQMPPQGYAQPQYPQQTQFTPPGYPPQTPPPGYPQGQPVPPKKKSKKGLIALGIIVGAVVLCAAIFSSHAGSDSSSSTASTSSLTTSSSNTTQQQQQAPSQPKTWQTTHTYTGTGEKKTETFTVGDDWKITWTCQGTDGMDAPLFVTVYNSDGTTADFDAVSTTCKAASPTTDTTEEHQGGNVYLDVNAGISWTLTIQELK